MASFCGVFRHYPSREVIFYISLCLKSDIAVLLCVCVFTLPLIQFAYILFSEKSHERKLH